MTEPLKVLIVEDRPSDAELVLYELRHAGFEPDWQRVETETDYLDQLHEGLDVILADFTLPQFDALRALHLWRERSLDVPFIVVTGSISEEVAVECMKLGAADYLLKDRMARLGQAVEQVLKEKRLRDEKRFIEEALKESEERYRNIFDTAPVSIWEEDFSAVKSAIDDLKAQGVRDLRNYLDEHPEFLMHVSQMIKVKDVNDTTLKMFKANTKEELLGSLDSVFVPETLEIFKEEVIAIAEGRTFFEGETINQTLTGERLNVLLTLAIPTDPGKLDSVLVSLMDITERAQAEERIQRESNRTRALLDTANRISGEHDLGKVLQIVCQETVSGLNVPIASVYLFDDQRQLFYYADGYGLPPNVSERLPEVPRPYYEELSGKLGSPIIITDIQTITGLPGADVFEECGIRTNISVMMSLEDRIIGALNVNTTGEVRHFTNDELDLLVGLADQASLAIENTRLLRETGERAAQLALLYDAGLALNSMLEPIAQLEFLFEIAMETLNADRAEFHRYNSLKREIQFELGVGHSQEVLAKLNETRFSTDEERGLIGWVIKNRIPLNVPDLQADTRYILIDPDIQSGLWAPVEHDGEVRGVLSVFSTQAHAFTLDDERLLTLFANQAAVAIENARLYEETRRQAGELAGLYDTAIVISKELGRTGLLERLYEQVNGLIQTDSFLLVLYDRKTKEVYIAFAMEEGESLTEWVGERMSLDEAGMTGWVARTQKPLLVGDLEKDPLPVEPKHGARPARSWLGVPLIARGHLVGVMSVQALKPNVFDESHQRLIVSLASQVAIGLENARLFEEAQERLQHLSALRKIDKAITCSFDLEMTLDIFLEQTIGQLKVDAADVLLLNQYTQELEYVAGSGFNTSALQNTFLRLGESHAGKAALERKMVAVDDLSEHPRGFTQSVDFAREGFIAYYGVPLIAKGQVKGVLEIFHRSPLSPDQDWLGFLDTLSGQAAIAIENSVMFDNIQKANVELSLAYDTTLEGWSRALELRDMETEGHSQRVTRMTQQLARALGMIESELVHVRRGALLHDIGKMGIPDNILLKPGKLTDEEWEIMCQHPGFAYRLLSPISYLRPALDIPYCHHEKWDGNGYPRGLKGEQIPLAARIFAVVDVWDALNSDRPYRDAWTEENVIAYIHEQSGKHFDPQVVEKFWELNNHY